MGFLIALLTLVMVLDCVILIFLVLIQLPKKEAGAGLAFGGAGADALFGAGSGNVLTKITKYAAGIFFIMAIVLSVMLNVYNNRSQSAFQRNLANPGPSAPGVLPPTIPTSAPPAGTNSLNFSATNAVEATNLPRTALTNIPPATNAPPK